MTCKTLILAMVSLLCTTATFADSIRELRPDIEDSAKRYGIDAALLEAVLRHESGNGKSRVARVYNNLGGVMKGKKYKKFSSREECVDYVAHILYVYRERGLVNTDQIAKRYAPYHRAEWTRCVNFFKKKIESGQI